MTLTPTPGRLGIRVTGIPIPQGSKKIVRRGHGTFLVDTNDKKLAPWRDHIHATAQDTLRYHDTITGPVRVWLTFAFDRPRSHYRTGRNAELLKDTAPRAATSHGLGDVDKLTRAVFDALTTAQVWTDDALVIDTRVRKFYAGEHPDAPPTPGVDIVLEELA